MVIWLNYLTNYTNLSKQFYKVIILINLKTPLISDLHLILDIRPKTYACN